MKILKTSLLLFVLACNMIAVKAAPPANNIDKITNAYLGLKNALAAGNSAVVQSKGKELLNVLSVDPGKGLRPEQQKTLNSYIDKLKFDSRHISESTAIEHQREHFVSLSKNMYDVLKSLKMNSSTVYEQYCPMKKAYWLSETTAIKNPYYNSKEMATCGRTTATLTGVK